MSELVQAAILGIIQGITEFLPVSSSGHLELAEIILNVKQKDSIWMTIVLHFATALATIVVYFKDILNILKALFRFQWNDSTRFSFKILLSMIPAGLLGYWFEDWIESLFDGQILLVGCMLILTAILLYLADRAKRTNKNVSFLDAFLIGIAQAFAILPGISRSGATISTSVLLGVDREKSARFSFLMVVPVIFGIIVKKLLDVQENGLSDLNITALTIGFLSAFFTGLFACKWMIALVKKAQLKFFSYYCVIVGLIAISWALFF